MNTVLPLPLCDSHKSVLVVIDIQQRLAEAMPEKILKQVIANTAFLIQSAKLLDIPVIISEQYPKGLGSTVTELTTLENAHIIEKTCFSCADSKAFLQTLGKLNKPQIILCGMEAHICVAQTAIELQSKNYQVFVASDSICSRKKSHFRNAIQRVQQQGCIITNSESISFEWLRDAKHEHFKSISKLLK